MRSVCAGAATVALPSTTKRAQTSRGGDGLSACGADQVVWVGAFRLVLTRQRARRASTTADTTTMAAAQAPSATALVIRTLWHSGRMSSPVPPAKAVAGSPMHWTRPPGSTALTGATVAAQHTSTPTAATPTIVYLTAFGTSPRPTRPTRNVAAISTTNHSAYAIAIAFAGPLMGSAAPSA